tara:strand:- start:3923 stop:5686 length:1764 start_codon:yes stop_codon:yes gene_type:complete
MKDNIKNLVSQAVATLQQQEQLPDDIQPNIIIENTRDPKHGDFACNIAMMLAKPAKRNPRELAQLIIDHLPKNSQVTKMEIAGPGFINFFLADDAYQTVIADVLKQQQQFGHHPKQDKKYLIEFVSANPTGPLHVGHGRGAAYGDCIANLLATQGVTADREYYVNDAGRQMAILAASVWLRYLELQGAEFDFPVNGYKGEYIYDIAKALQKTYNTQFVRDINTVFADVPADEVKNDKGDVLSGDKEAHIDGVIANAKQLLGDDYRVVFDTGLQDILSDIKQDLAEYRIEFDCWFSEKQLMDNGAIDHCIDVLTKAGHMFEQEGALWFKATAFGDEKDRVVKRANGQTTYFASDIAYHLNKLERGYDVVVDVLGADHHGYVPRLKAGMQAMANREDALTVPLVQFVSLYRGGKKVQMSTRSGSFITLRELREEIGNDAARFFYVMRKIDQAMDFDLDLAKSKSNENPVYYIQYAHARVCSVLRQINDWSQDNGLQQLNCLTEVHEKDLCKRLAQYSELLSNAAFNYDPHLLANYLRELANDFHSYYNHHQFLVDDVNIRDARLCLITACKQIFANGLQLLGVTAPDQM